ncbi:MAG: hypothetical protein ACK5II_07125 [Paracoccus sp. (in: a-proteobacteria)]
MIDNSNPPCQAFDFTIPVTQTGRSRWPPGFKKYVIEKLETDELTVSQIAEESRIKKSLIYKWQAKSRSANKIVRPSKTFAQVLVGNKPAEQPWTEDGPPSVDVQCIHLRGVAANLILPPDYPIENLVRLVQAMEATT